MVVVGLRVVVLTVMKLCCRIFPYCKLVVVCVFVSLSLKKMNVV